mmetsp:Transcript_20913/g.21236  ORF Transcript_20913/g.21236 Transcript_20913/m.21236 type:complete len:84 (+) Transcript_20913:541-792(+)
MKQLTGMTLGNGNVYKLPFEVLYLDDNGSAAARIHPLEGQRQRSSPPALSKKNSDNNNDNSTITTMEQYFTILLSHICTTFQS